MYDNIVNPNVSDLHQLVARRIHGNDLQCEPTSLPLWDFRLLRTFSVRRSTVVLILGGSLSGDSSDPVKRMVL